MSNLEIPPEYNWAQIEVILYVLENIDISMWDEGYRKIYKHLYERFRKLKEEIK